jgi:(E)-4-hydroxy-3-methylbut-2-enyl-diphosphate synthase
MEYTRICRKMDFHNIIYSMKSSNPTVMIHAYRLLVAEMRRLGWDYPLHLGVTEAGEGEDGRVKSAMGIGSLLLDGLGDTIRVSLTEDPQAEIDPCSRLVSFAAGYQGKGVADFNENYRNWNEITRRSVQWPRDIAMHRDGTVIVPVDQVDLTALGCENGKLTRSAADAVLSSDRHPELVDIGIGVFGGDVPLIPLAEAPHRLATSKFQLGVAPVGSRFALQITDEQDWHFISRYKPSAIFLAPSDNRLHFSRKFFDWLQAEELRIPVILNFSYACSQEDFVIQAAAECGALLADGLGEGLCLETPFDTAFVRKFSFNILQAARMRTTKTEFISCPSCGRTLFDLQDVTRRIRSRTEHLPGVKIAIMGCIVNGPGEMADADFGYVGSRPGKIDLYVGKECVERNIDFADADDRLIALIKAHNRWVDPAEVEAL